MPEADRLADPEAGPGQELQQQPVVVRRLGEDGGELLAAEDLGLLVLAGRLVTVLEDWCPVSPGLYVYYASRRQPSRALSLIVDALRYRA